MPQQPDWSKYLDAGAEFVAMTRTQARQRAKVLVGQGKLAQDQVQGFVDDLVDESKRRTDLMLDVVRKEIQRQVKTLGIATKDDLARLEARIAKYAGSGNSSTQKQPAKAASKKTSKKPNQAASKKSAKKSAKKSSKQSAKPKKATKKSAKKSTKQQSRRAAPKAASS